MRSAESVKHHLSTVFTTPADDATRFTKNT